MSRVCPITKRRVVSSMKLSHAHNKTKRLFVPNLQNVSFISPTLGFKVHLRISTAAIKTIEKFGGIDAFLKRARKPLLSPELIRMRRRVMALSDAAGESASGAPAIAE